MKKRLLTALAALLVLICCCLPVFPKNALADALDEILKYTVTADVNEDATVTLTYHIEWKVLDDESEGPLEWVKIGIPNEHYVSMRALSSNISEIDYYDDGGAYVRIDFDRSYYEDEVVSFDFEVVQDYLYQMNLNTEGETIYEFIPGWFMDIAVDELVIRWNSDKVTGYSPAAPQETDGYITWTLSLEPAQKAKISVAYPNDAFAFKEDQTIEIDDKTMNGEISQMSSAGGAIASAIGGLLFFAIFILPFIGIIVSIANYAKKANFSTETKKKITRTKVVYYPTCQGCGAPRPEGANNCEYCGRSFIKSEETVTEEEVPQELKDKKTDGIYRYGSDPNTFMRVHVVPVVVSAPRRSGGFFGGSGGGCAHSSCACASHCACACACACAGGGRAGCTTKDFYNTGLKLKQLELKNKKTK